MSNPNTQLDLFAKPEPLKRIVKDGIELYYDTVNDKTGTSINGLARIVGCDPKTIQHITHLHPHTAETLDAFTNKGIQTIKFIDYSNIVTCLKMLIDGKRVSKQTKDSVSTLIGLIAIYGIEAGLTKHICVKPKRKQRIPSVNEKSVADYIKAIYVALENEVRLQPKITLDYRPDMMIYLPQQDLRYAVEVEPYDRRRYGLQQAITYAKLSGSLPYLITFGCQNINKEEASILKEHQIFWTHIKFATLSSFKGIEIQNGLAGIPKNTKDTGNKTKAFLDSLVNV